VEDVIVVGSGITGLMTAWEVVRSGRTVTVVSQSPDPRASAPGRPHLSSTFDSPNDQRYVTLFEGHPYLEIGGYIGRMYPRIGESFERSVIDGGWLAHPSDRFDPQTQAWLAERQSIDARLRSGDPDTTSATRELFDRYERENRAAMSLWYEAIPRLLEISTDLKASLPLHHRGILRLYDDAPVFAQARESHDRGGVLLRSLTPEELVEAFPAYAAGVDNGFIQGGALETVGLALGVKTIGIALIDIIERCGGSFQFGIRVERVVVEHGVAKGLRLSDGRTVRATHYLLHPGAYATRSLLAQTGAPAVAAMAGCWVTIEGADEIVNKMGRLPNKVHGQQSLDVILDRLPEQRRDWYQRYFSSLGTATDVVAPVVDFNNMPLPGPSLGVGSGYVFEGVPTGEDAPRFVPSERARRVTLLTIQLWLEALHGHDLLSCGRIVEHGTVCRRSWTADDREIDIQIPTDAGGILGVRGGGNTGDTTKSTLIARYNVELLDAASESGIDNGREIRRALGKSASDLGPQHWRACMEGLDPYFRSS